MNTNEVASWKACLVNDDNVQQVIISEPPFQLFKARTGKGKASFRLAKIDNISGQLKVFVILAWISAHGQYKIQMLFPQKNLRRISGWLIVPPLGAPPNNPPTTAFWPFGIRLLRAAAFGRRPTMTRSDSYFVI